MDLEKSIRLLLSLETDPTNPASINKIKKDLDQVSEAVRKTASTLVDLGQFDALRKNLENLKTIIPSVLKPMQRAVVEMFTAEGKAAQDSAVKVQKYFRDMEKQGKNPQLVRQMRNLFPALGLGNLASNMTMPAMQNLIMERLRGVLYPGGHANVSATALRATGGMNLFNANTLSKFAASATADRVRAAKEEARAVVAAKKEEERAAKEEARVEERTAKESARAVVAAKREEAKQVAAQQKEEESNQRTRIRRFRRAFGLARDQSAGMTSSVFGAFGQVASEFPGQAGVGGLHGALRGAALMAGANPLMAAGVAGLQVVTAGLGVGIKFMSNVIHNSVGVLHGMVSNLIFKLGAVVTAVVAFRTLVDAVKLGNQENKDRQRAGYLLRGDTPLQRAGFDKLVDQLSDNTTYERNIVRESMLQTRTLGASYDEMKTIMRVSMDTAATIGKEAELPEVTRAVTYAFKQGLMGEFQRLTGFTSFIGESPYARNARMLSTVWNRQGGEAARSADADVLGTLHKALEELKTAVGVGLIDNIKDLVGVLKEWLNNVTAMKNVDMAKVIQSMGGKLPDEYYKKDVETGQRTPMSFFDIMFKAVGDPFRQFMTLDKGEDPKKGYWDRAVGLLKGIATPIFEFAVAYEITKWKILFQLLKNVLPSFIRGVLRMVMHPEQAANTRQMTSVDRMSVRNYDRKIVEEMTVLDEKRRADPHHMLPASAYNTINRLRDERSDFESQFDPMSDLNDAMEEGEKQLSFDNLMGTEEKPTALRQVVTYYSDPAHVMGNFGSLAPGASPGMQAASIFAHQEGDAALTMAQLAGPTYDEAVKTRKAAQNANMGPYANGGVPMPNNSMGYNTRQGVGIPPYYEGGQMIYPQSVNPLYPVNNAIRGTANNAGAPGRSPQAASTAITPPGVPVDPTYNYGAW